MVIVNRVSIGKRCEIQSGCIIGHDGFGYTEDEAHNKTMVKHFGGVTIGDEVYLAMNTVVERGVIDDSEIKRGTKIDCLSLIGHNSVIGEKSALVGGTILYGSCHLGENSYIAGALLRNQCSVGDNAFVGLGAVVVKDVPADTTVIGNPAKPYNKKEV